MLTGHTASSVLNKYEHRELTNLRRIQDGLEKMQFPEVALPNCITVNIAEGGIASSCMRWRTERGTLPYDGQ